ncbi:hypothetical protein FQN60_001779 [Etheostoma spectabile]|uniref:Uncharacterized protein n=1 Tax=Etheostoma spectabile TaxID=54343 RepID=A0A5J5DCY0_9PERO|nr:hypothetical protein FQN60_001779 [Etheostoma spectabile]
MEATACSPPPSPPSPTPSLILRHWHIHAGGPERSVEITVPIFSKTQLGQDKPSRQITKIKLEFSYEELTKHKMATVCLRITEWRKLFHNSAIERTKPGTEQDLPWFTLPPVWQPGCLGHPCDPETQRESKGESRYPTPHPQHCGAVRPGEASNPPQLLLLLHTKLILSGAFDKHPPAGETSRLTAAVQRRGKLASSQLHGSPEPEKGEPRR